MPRFKMTGFDARHWPDGLNTNPRTADVEPGEEVEADENPDPHFFELVEEKRAAKPDKTEQE